MHSWGSYFVPDPKGSVKNNLVKFAPEFAVDLIDLIEQNRRKASYFEDFCD